MLCKARISSVRNVQSILHKKGKFIVRNFSHTKVNFVADQSDDTEFPPESSNKPQQQPRRQSFETAEYKQLQSQKTQKQTPTREFSFKEFRDPNDNTKKTVYELKEVVSNQPAPNVQETKLVNKQFTTKSYLSNQPKVEKGQVVKVAERMERVETRTTTLGTPQASKKKFSANEQEKYALETASTNTAALKPVDRPIQHSKTTKNQYQVTKADGKVNIVNETRREQVTQIQSAGKIENIPIHQTTVIEKTHHQTVEIAPSSKLSKYMQQPNFKNTTSGEPVSTEDEEELFTSKFESLLAQNKSDAKDRSSGKSKKQGAQKTATKLKRRVDIDEGDEEDEGKKFEVRRKRRENFVPDFVDDYDMERQKSEWFGVSSQDRQLGTAEDFAEEEGAEAYGNGLDEEFEDDVLDEDEIDLEDGVYLVDELPKGVRFEEVYDENDAIEDIDLSQVKDEDDIDTETTAGAASFKERYALPDFGLSRKEMGTDPVEYNTPVKAEYLRLDDSSIDYRDDVVELDSDAYTTKEQKAAARRMKVAKESIIISTKEVEEMLDRFAEEEQMNIGEDTNSFKLRNDDLEDTRAMAEQDMADDHDEDALDEAEEGEEEELEEGDAAAAADDDDSDNIPAGYSLQGEEFENIFFEPGVDAKLVEQRNEKYPEQDYTEEETNEIFYKLLQKDSFLQETFNKLHPDVLAQDMLQLQSSVNTRLQDLVFNGKFTPEEADVFRETFPVLTSKFSPMKTSQQDYFADPDQLLQDYNARVREVIGGDYLNFSKIEKVKTIYLNKFKQNGTLNDDILDAFEQKIPIDEFYSQFETAKIAIARMRGVEVNNLSTEEVNSLLENFKSRGSAARKMRAQIKKEKEAPQYSEKEINDFEKRKSAVFITKMNAEQLAERLELAKLPFEDITGIRAPIPHSDLVEALENRLDELAERNDEEVAMDKQIDEMLAENHITVQIARYKSMMQHYQVNYLGRFVKRPYIPDVISLSAAGRFGKYSVMAPLGQYFGDVTEKVPYDSFAKFRLTEYAKTIVKHPDMSLLEKKKTLRKYYEQFVERGADKTPILSMVKPEHAIYPGQLSHMHPKRRNSLWQDYVDAEVKKAVEKGINLEIEDDGNVNFFDNDSENGPGVEL